MASNENEIAQPPMKKLLKTDSPIVKIVILVDDLGYVDWISCFTQHCTCNNTHNDCISQLHTRTTHVRQMSDKTTRTASVENVQKSSTTFAAWYWLRQPMIYAKTILIKFVDIWPDCLPPPRAMLTQNHRIPDPTRSQIAITGLECSQPCRQPKVPPRRLLGYEINMQWRVDIMAMKWSERMKFDRISHNFELWWKLLYW